MHQLVATSENHAVRRQGWEELSAEDAHRRWAAYQWLADEIEQQRKPDGGFGGAATWLPPPVWKKVADRDREILFGGGLLTGARGYGYRFASSALEDVVRRTLAKSPSDRWPSAAGAF